jgi:hypothetical protein
VSSFKKVAYNLHKLKYEFAGYDERFINKTEPINFDLLYEFNRNYEKVKLLEKLSSTNINQNDKLKLIYNSNVLYEMNPNVIKAPNLTKGLKF